MDKVLNVAEVARKAYWREEDARVVVEALRSSGASVAEFAHDIGVMPERIERWAKRLSVECRDRMPFLPVHLVGNEPAGAVTNGIEIELTGGEVVRVPRGFSIEDLRRVLAVLEERAC